MTGGVGPKSSSSSELRLLLLPALLLLLLVSPLLSATLFVASFTTPPQSTQKGGHERLMLLPRRHVTSSSSSSTSLRGQGRNSNDNNTTHGDGGTPHYLTSSVRSHGHHRHHGTGISMSHRYLARNPWLIPLSSTSSYCDRDCLPDDNINSMVVQTTTDSSKGFGFIGRRWRNSRQVQTTKGIIQEDPTTETDDVDQELNNDDGDSDDEVDSPRLKWLRWMTGGKPRGTNKVIMREAKELGGVPRSARYSSRDWFHTIITFPNSGVLRDTKSPVLFITGWATLLSLVYEALRSAASCGSATAAAWMKFLPVPLPLAPHSLMMSVLGLLLVFRTNSAYQRFVEGRKIWENIINTSRDIYRMLMLYEREIGIDRRRRLQRLLAAFPYLLRHRIRPQVVKMHRLDDETIQRDPKQTILLYQDEGPTDDTDLQAAALAETEEETTARRRLAAHRKPARPLFWVDRRTLPWRLLPPGEALEKCARAQNRPLWVCDRMAAEIRNVPIDQSPHFTNRERLALMAHVDKLSRYIGGAERIHQTVVPLNYARHTLRALTIWLVSFPFVVVKDLKLLTGPSLFLVTWMLFGIFQIGYDIEDPFQGTYMEGAVSLRYCRIKWQCSKQKFTLIHTPHLVLQFFKSLCRYYSRFHFM
jgi:predicted membrane chloride channel (bestrophin family)